MGKLKQKFITHYFILVMSMSRYTKVSVPKELADEIRKTINKYKELGYRSVSEFFIDVARRRLEEIKKMMS